MKHLQASVKASHALRMHVGRNTSWEMKMNDIDEEDPGLLTIVRGRVSGAAP